MLKYLVNRRCAKNWDVQWRMQSRQGAIHPSIGMRERIPCQMGADPHQSCNDDHEELPSTRETTVTHVVAQPAPYPCGSKSLMGAFTTIWKIQRTTSARVM